MPRGGKRPGAGAPKGNINALKHGRRSRRLSELGAQVAASPSARRILLRLAEREDLEVREADRIAANIIDQVLERGLKRGRDRLILLPPLNDGPTTKKTDTKGRPSERGKGRKLQNTLLNNQSADAEPRAQSENS
jgi:hypothetical protein